MKEAKLYDSVQGNDQFAKNASKPLKIKAFWGVYQNLRFLVDKSISLCYNMSTTMKRQKWRENLKYKTPLNLKLEQSKKTKVKPH